MVSISGLSLVMGLNIGDVVIGHKVVDTPILNIIFDACSFHETLFYLLVVLKCIAVLLESLRLHIRSRVPVIGDLNRNLNLLDEFALLPTILLFL